MQKHIGMLEVVLMVVMGFCVLAGCASAPPRVLSVIAPSYATLPNGAEPLHPTQVSPLYAAVTATPGDNLFRISCDYGTGIAGVLRTLHRLTHLDEADFVLDGVVPNFSSQDLYEAVETAV